MPSLNVTIRYVSKYHTEITLCNAAGEQDATNFRDKIEEAGYAVGELRKINNIPQWKFTVASEANAVSTHIKDNKPEFDVSDVDTKDMPDQRAN